MLLASFRGYLCHERGVAPGTAAAYVGCARRFVAGYAADGDLTRPEGSVTTSRLPSAPGVRTQATTVS
ncbi:MAG TPA: hypothetical protein VMZ51_03000 [Acidimicrobiales bacterium]|nr:hypothetical protein [Acidimicrobiales bacterium]